VPALKWLADAVEDLDRLLRFLADASPEAAARAATAVLEGADELVRNPGIGRPLGDGRREWFIPFGVGAYVLRYRVAPDETLVILRVWHSREDRD